MSVQVAAPAVSWHGFARSVRGASHIRRGAPNQDAGGTAPLQGGSGIVLAVADGHGDKLHARSERGSRFAVAIALELVGQWIGDATSAPTPALTEGTAELKAQLVESWRAAVDADLEADPPRLVNRGHDGAEANDGRVLYGTTLIVAALTDTCAVYVQIGDGDLLAVTEGGHARRVFPVQADLPLNRTDSLCQPDALERLRIGVEPFADVPAPVFVLLSTDGYANSFSDEAAFQQVALDLKDYVAHRGLAWVEGQAEGWLNETSADGSGDDITLAVAWRGGAPRSAPDPPECKPVPNDPRRNAQRWTARKLASAVTSGIALAMLVVVLSNVLGPIRFRDVGSQPRSTPAASPTATLPPISDIPSFRP